MVCDLCVCFPAVLGFSHLPIFQGVPDPWIFVLPLAVAVPHDGMQLEKLPSLNGSSVHHNRGTVDILSISTHVGLNTSLSLPGHCITKISSTDFQLETH